MVGEITTSITSRNAIKFSGRTLKIRMGTFAFGVCCLIMPGIYLYISVACCLSLCQPFAFVRSILLLISPPETHIRHFTLLRHTKAIVLIVRLMSHRPCKTSVVLVLKFLHVIFGENYKFNA